MSVALKRVYPCFSLQQLVISGVICEQVNLGLYSNNKFIDNLKFWSKRQRTNPKLWMLQIIWEWFAYFKSISEPLQNTPFCKQYKRNVHSSIRIAHKHSKCLLSLFVLSIHFIVQWNNCLQVWFWRMSHIQVICFWHSASSIKHLTKKKPRNFKCLIHICFN